MTRRCEGQDFDPFNIAHRRHKPGNGADMRRIIGQAGDEDIADPDRLADCRRPLGETERRRQIDARQPMKRRRVAGFNIEQDEVDLIEIGVIRACAQTT